MSEVKDPAIKLFGKTISFPTHSELWADAECENIRFSSSREESSVRQYERDNKRDKEFSGKEINTYKREDCTLVETLDDSKTPTTSSGISENINAPSLDRETSSPKTPKDEEKGETSSPPGKTPKKPDKILPCPRCDSMDTKFCYYNNYNVNQPRHFCKNCQRYWTAGGTMRNVPVGAGRRKNKNSSASQYHPIMISEALQTAPTNAFLSFGTDYPLSDSMASVLNLADKQQNGVGIGFQRPEQKGFPFPLSFYPAPAYWGCASWNMPCLSPPPSTLNHLVSGSVLNSTKLGKHSREGDIINSQNSQKEEHVKGSENSRNRILIPKTLRIDDLSEAAKSSIWRTLGIKNERDTYSKNEGSLFKTFKSNRSDEKNHVSGASVVLGANPAALSRSLNFQESA